MFSTCVSRFAGQKLSATRHAFTGCRPGFGFARLMEYGLDTLTSHASGSDSTPWTGALSLMIHLSPLGSVNSAPAAASAEG